MKLFQKAKAKGSKLLDIFADVTNHINKYVIIVEVIFNISLFYRTQNERLAYFYL